MVEGFAICGWGLGVLEFCDWGMGLVGRLAVGLEVPDLLSSCRNYSPAHKLRTLHVQRLGFDQGNSLSETTQGLDLFARLS